MKQVRLGRTGYVVEQNGFGALPIQRVDFETAGRIMNKALDAGMNFIDTARAYSDSEEKIGATISHRRNEYVLATKTMATTPEQFRKDLETSLRNLKTECIDIYQFHCVNQCYKPGDGTGMYECMEEAKKQGKIAHICVTAHKIGVAEEIVASGLYDTLQFPFCYLATDRDKALVEACKKADIGFIAMKGLSGGLLTNSRAASAFMDQYDNVVPIWGIQKESELDEFIALMKNPAHMDDELRAFIEKDKAELSGEFCRGCGYCMPCPAGIQINNCARMIQLIRRSPSAGHLTPEAQARMEKIDDCINCKKCMTHCPYGLNIPELLKKNLADYRKIVSGEIKV